MQEPAIGHTLWAIAEGYIPQTSKEAQIPGQETLCILNASNQDARVCLTIYFTDSAPLGGYEVRVPARRTSHIRLNDLVDPAPIPLDTDFACVVSSDVPVVVQSTRLDTRQAENTLFITQAFAMR